MRNVFRKIGLFAGIGAGILLAAACDNTVSLGSRLDLTSPVITIDGSQELPRAAGAPGSYVRDGAVVYINAADDSGVLTFVGSKISYWVLIDPKNDQKEQITVSLPADYDSDSKRYRVDFDTKNAPGLPADFRQKYPVEQFPDLYHPRGESDGAVWMADGQIDMVLTATDSSGKTTTTPPIVYNVDNTPPVVEVQVPKAVYTFNTSDGQSYIELDPAKIPSLVRGSEIIGVMSDDQGLRQGYPLIKLWRNDSGNEPPPVKYQDNAGWADVVSVNEKTDWFGKEPEEGYDSTNPWDHRSGGWIPADQGYISDGKDKPIARQFRLVTRKHDVHGKPLRGTTDAEDDALGYKLPLGTYSIMVRAADLSKPDSLNPNGLETFFPVKDSAGTVRIDFKLEENAYPPTVEISTSPAAQYMRGDFSIHAEARPREPDTDISFLELRVDVKYKNPPKAGTTRPPTGSLLLKKVERPNTESGLGGLAALDLDVKFGDSYNNLAECTNGTADPDYMEITFVDGTYTFIAYAQSYTSGSTNNKMQNVSLDRRLPQTNINSVYRYYKQEDIPAKGNYGPGVRQYTVNGTIELAVNYNDNQGIARETDTGYTRFKYILYDGASAHHEALPSYLIIPDTPVTPTDTQAAEKQAKAAELWVRPEAVYVEGSMHHAGVMIEGREGEYTIKVRTQTYNETQKKYDLWFYIIGQDNAGNFNYARTLLYVDQDTDKPEVAIGSIRKDGSDLFNENLIIRITAVDDDGFFNPDASAPLNKYPLEFRYHKDLGTNKGGARPNDASTGWSRWYTVPMGSPSASNLYPGTSFAISPDGRSVSEFQLPISALYRYLTTNPQIEYPTSANPGDNFTSSYNTNKAALWTALGPEGSLKGIQFRIRDDQNKKVPFGALLDDPSENDPNIVIDTPEKQVSSFVKFTLDLTPPKVDIDSFPLGVVNTLTTANPFHLPKKETSYNKSFVAEGWLKETYFRYFRVIVDSKIAVDSASVDKWTVPQYDDSTSTPPANFAGVYQHTVRNTETANPYRPNWNKEDIKWRFPMNSLTPNPNNGNQMEPLWNQLEDGAHNFRIDLVDWAGNTTSEQVTFYKDVSGPSIKFGNVSKLGGLTGADAGLNGTYPRLNDGDWAKIKTSQENTIPHITPILEGLTQIGEVNAKLQGTFVDAYSKVGKKFWYHLEKKNTDGSVTKWPNASKGAKNGWLPLEANGDSDISMNWAIPIPAFDAGGGDGIYRVSILAQDQYENGYGEKTGGLWSEPDAAAETTGSGLGYEHNLIFTVDSTGPEVYFVTFPGGAADANSINIRAPFDFTVRAYDSSIIKGVLGAWIQAPGGSGHLNPLDGVRAADNPAYPGFTIWNFTGMKTEGLAAGTTYTLFVQAVDQANHSTVIDCNLLFDNGKPTGEIILPTPGPGASSSKFLPLRVTAQPKANGETLSSTVIQGTASDNRGVKYINYKFGKDATSWKPTNLHSAKKTDWDSLWSDSSGVNNWKFNLPALNMASAADQAKADRVILDTSKYSSGYDINSDTHAYTLTNRPPSTSDTQYNWWLLPFQVQIIDLAGNETVLEYYIIIDPDMDIPTVVISYPVEIEDPPNSGNKVPPVVGGQIRVQGTAEDDNFVKQVQYRISTTQSGSNWVWDDSPDAWKTATLRTSGPSVTWFFDINANHELDPPANQTKRVMLEVAAQDSRDYGNTGSVWSYPHGSQTAGKRYYLPLIFDATVPVVDEIKIDRHDNSAYTQWPELTYGTMASRYFTIHANIHDESGLTRISWEDGDNKLTDLYYVTTDSGAAVSLSPTTTSVQSGKKYIIASQGTAPRFTGIGAVSNARGVSFTADSTTTLGTNEGTVVLMDGAKRSNAYVLGPMAGPVTAAGNTLAAGDWYKIVNAGNTDFKSLFGAADNDPGTLFRPTADQIAGLGSGLTGTVTDVTYKVVVEVDSLANPAYKDKLGTYTMLLRAEDNSNPPKPTQANISIQIDNLYPLANYTGIGPDIMGEYYYRGTATDNGSIETLDKVVVWFTKEPSASNPKGHISLYEGLASSADPNSKFYKLQQKYGWTDAQFKEFKSKKLEVLDMSGSGSGTLKEIDFPDDVKSGIIINRNEVSEGSGSDIDSDDFIEGWMSAGASQAWYAIFDSENIIGGQVMLNFAVFDKAGNAAYYKLADHWAKDDTGVLANKGKYMVKNHGPRIMHVSLQTSLYNGTANLSAPIEKATKGVVLGIDGNYQPPYRVITDPLFSVRNNYLNLTLDVMNGNVQNRYRISYMKPKTATVTALKAKAVYRIAAKGAGKPTAGNLTWSALGAPDDVPAAGTIFVAAYDQTLANGWTVNEYEAAGTALDVVKEGNLAKGPGDNNSGDTAAVPFTVFGATIEDAINGAVFHVKVWDTVDAAHGSDENRQIVDEAYLALTIANTDAWAPKARLYDLNPMARNYTKIGNTVYEADTVISAASANTTAAPDPIKGTDAAGNTGLTGQEVNIRKGGLFRDDSGLISGHIEPRRADTSAANSFFDFLKEDKTKVWIADGVLMVQNAKPAGTSVTELYDKDTVSGKVLLRGSATDNQRITEVHLVIGSSDIKILQASSTGRLEAVPALADAVFVEDVLDITNADNHRVEWTYVWDTAALPAAVAGPATVKVYAVDAKPANSAEVTLASGALDTFNSLEVDIAPYIRDIARNPLKYGTSRSKQGWYSFRLSSGSADNEDDEVLTIRGFNLSGGSNAELTIGGKDMTSSIGSQNKDIVAVTLPVNNTGVKSGEIAFRVGSIPAVNNRNNDLNAWNKEKGVEGSEYWTDNRYAHIWQTNNTVAGDNRGFVTGEPAQYPVHPAMTIDPLTGVLYSSWANYAENRILVAPNNDDSSGSNIQATNNTNGYIISMMDASEHTDIYWTTGRKTNSTGLTVAYNANLNIASWSWTNAGGSVIWDGNAKGITSWYGTNRGYMAESLNFNQRLMQFVNQRVVTYKDNIHHTYYDTATKAMKYYYTASGTQTSVYNGNEKKWLVIDGGIDEHDVATATTTTQTYTFTNGAYIRSVQPSLAVGQDVNYSDELFRYDNTPGTTGGTAFRASQTGRILSIKFPANWNPGTDSKIGSNSVITILYGPKNAPLNERVVDGGTIGSDAAGEYSAVDVTNQGYPVIAYYDISHQTVKLAYTSSVTPNKGADWHIQYVMKNTDPNYSFSGRYISMRIDTKADGADKDRIHIAFNRGSTGDLIYITGTRNADGSYTFGDSVIVDSVGSVGKWADVSLDEDGRPYITYVDSSRVDSFNGLKMAFCDPGIFPRTDIKDDKGKSLTGWETVNIATIYHVSDVRVSIENFPTRRTDIEPVTATQFWNSAIGYSTGDNYRFAYYIKP
jgi:hypothetical protein